MRRLPIRRPRGSFTRLRGPKEPFTPGQASVVATMITLSALAVWFVAYALFFSGLREHHQQAIMYEHLRQNLALATVPIGGVIALGTPVALIDAPQGGVHNQVIAEGSTSEELEKGPGHLADTPLPGQAGVSVVLGRSATFGSPFGKISHLEAGDPITVTTGQGTFDYRVSDVRRPGDPLPTVLSGNQSRLTLVTASGSGWRSGWAPNGVVYVDAALVTGKVQPTPAGRPVTVASSALPLHGDTGGLVSLFLWLQALVLLTAGAVYARLRWSGWGRWIVGLPLAIAVLWGTTSSVMYMLPNIA